MKAYKAEFKFSSNFIQYPPGKENETAEAIMEQLCPNMQYEYSPRATEGDGNCMFRALSLTLSGSEELHSLLRLLCAVKVANYRAWYDACIQLVGYLQVRLDACLTENYY